VAGRVPPPVCVIAGVAALRSNPRKKARLGVPATLPGSIFYLAPAYEAAEKVEKADSSRTEVREE